MPTAMNVSKSLDQENPLGQYIREARKRRGLTIRELADRTALSRTFLSNVENDINSPTITSLRVILAALDVSLTDLFRKVEEPALRVVPAGEAREIARMLDGDVTYSLLNSTADKACDIVLLQVAPGAKTTVEHGHEGEQTGFVVEGELCYWMGAEEIRLSTGDTLVVGRQSLTAFENTGDTPAKILWVVPSDFSHARANVL